MVTASSAHPSILIIAGEPSGDSHAARLVTALKKQRPELRFYGTGGDLMAAAGVSLKYHVKDLAVLGLAEVLRHLRFFMRVRDDLLATLETEKPVLIILVDYPGFNLRFARQVKKRYGIPVVYYIAPQVWAWGKKRIPLMRRVIDRLLVILPFEKDFFAEHGIAADYVGHPLTEVVKPSMDRETFCRSAGLDPSRPVLGLLPGSRAQEVQGILPVMTAAAAAIGKRAGIQPVIAASDNITPDLLRRYASGSDIPAVTGKTYDVMSHAALVLTASGTATLETAWCRTPMVILYRVSPVTWFIGSRLVKLSHIGLVNIVAGRQIVPENLQGRMRSGLVASAALSILQDEKRREAMTRELERTASLLGSGTPSETAAARILPLLDAK